LSLNEISTPRHEERDRSFLLPPRGIKRDRTAIKISSLELGEEKKERLISLILIILIHLWSELVSSRTQTPTIIDDAARRTKGKNSGPYRGDTFVALR